MNTTGTTPSINLSEHTHRQASLAFQEYQLVAEDTARITDRRQTVNTLFVSINTIFLTGVGYLMYKYAQSYQNSLQLVYFTAGFLVIAILTTVINRSWRRLSEQSRRLISLRIRYLEKLEKFMRETGYFPNIEVPLKGMDPNRDKEYEAPPLAINSSVSEHLDPAEVREYARIGAARAAEAAQTGALPAVSAASDTNDTKAAATEAQFKEPKTKRWFTTRGTYTLEEVLYNNPSPKFTVFGFSDAEQRVVAAFYWAYWIAFVAALLGLGADFITFFTNLHFSLGPLHF